MVMFLIAYFSCPDIEACQILNLSDWTVSEYYQVRNEKYSKDPKAHKEEKENDITDHVCRGERKSLLRKLNLFTSNHLLGTARWQTK